MAGMFYSLQEVAEKLNKSEEEVKQIIREGRLREFRDGPNLLFKVDEVEALISEIGAVISKEAPPEKEPETAEEEISLASETTEGPAAEVELTGADTAITGDEINILGETDSEYQLMDTTAENEAEPSEAILEEDTMAETKAESGEALIEDTMAETTAASGEALLEEDTMGGTKAAPDEASLEAIEEDVNLDTFGSGSGLLDLSLQADDTSLGGILDEIYAPEGGVEEQATVEAASAMDVTAEAEHILSETMQPGLEAPASAQIAAEAEPDTLSNTLGIMLFLPLLAIVYTAIVAVAGFSGVMPTILEKIQGIIWYIMIGLAVVACLIVGIAFMLSGEAGKVGKKKVKAP